MFTSKKRILLLNLITIVFLAPLFAFLIFISFIRSDSQQEQKVSEKETTINEDVKGSDIANDFMNEIKNSRKK